MDASSSPRRCAARARRSRREAGGPRRPWLAPPSIFSDGLATDHAFADTSDHASLDALTISYPPRSRPRPTPRRSRTSSWSAPASCASSAPASGRCLPAGWRVHAEDRADHPRGDGRHRLPGDADAGDQAGGAVAAERAATSIDEIFQLKDRKGADMVLAMTARGGRHLARRADRALLPRAPADRGTTSRPRSATRRGRAPGVLRTREFIMKDAYTFDRDARRPGRAATTHIGRLRPHLRPLRPRVVPGRVRRRDDGRRRRPRVHGAVPGGRERRRAGARLRRQRRGRERRARSRSSCPRRAAAPEEVADARADDDRRGRRRAATCRRARCSRPIP